MKIAFISSHISNSLQFVWFQQELKKKDIPHIHIVINTTGKDLLLVNDLRANDLPTYELQYRNFFTLFKLFFQIRRILKTEQTNLVHTTLPYGNLIGQLAALSLGISARVSTCENASWAFDYRSKKQWLIDKFTFWSAKKIISVADTANDFLIDKWRIRPDKLVQINHALRFVDYDSVSYERISSLKVQLGIQDGAFILGMISRTEFWKGHQYAVEAMVKIAAKHPNIQLLICGSKGFDHQRLLDLIAQHQLEQHVRYIGFVSDPIAFLKLIQVQVHVPINKYVENCGISIIEGMAARTPQLLSLSGYAYQSAQHLKNAYVVDYCNAAQIAEGIDFLYSHYDIARAMGEQAHKDALNDYALTRKVEQHILLYHSLLTS